MLCTAPGGIVYINFDTATDKANLKGIFDCGWLLAPDTVAKLAGSASAPHCTFVNASRVAAFLGNGATIQMNEKIAIAPSVKRGLRRLTGCADSAFPNGSLTRLCFFTSQGAGNSVRVNRPSNPVAPVAVLKGPSVLGPCDDLLLDASSSYGSAGREMQFYFGLRPGSPNDAAVRALIFKASHAPYSTNKIALPSKSMAQGANYSFVVSLSWIHLFFLTYISIEADADAADLIFSQLRIVNFLDVEDETELFVSKASDSSPVVQIQGPPTRQAFSSRPFKLRGDVSLSNCSGASDPTLDLQWSIVSIAPWGIQAPPLDPQTEQTRALYVPANALSPGYTYTFQLLASSAVRPAEAGADTVDVYCSFSPLVAVIDGGSRTVSALDALALDATQSHDLDDSASAASHPLMYSWGCETEGGGACFRDTEGVLLQSAARIALRAGTLVPGAYRFSVNVTKEPGPRRASTAVDVWVYPGRVPAVGISPLASPVVNPGVRLVLAGQLAAGAGPNATTLWTQTDGEDVLAYPALVSTQLGLPSLSIRPGVLVAGQAYAFRLTARDGAAWGFAELRFTVNAPPTSGSFAVSPTAGRGLADAFTLECRDWADSAEDMPLAYEFRYLDNATAGDPEIPLGTPDANVYQVTFPEPAGGRARAALTVVA